MLHPGENSTIGVLSLVANGAISPLSIWALAALGRKFPPSWTSAVPV
jgi:hypothetical protein